MSQFFIEYPKYATLFEKRFEEFFDRWKEIVIKPDELKKNKIYIYGYLARNIMYCILSEQMYNYVVNKFEKGDTKLKKIESALLKHLLEETFLNVELILKTALNIKNNLEQEIKEKRKLKSTYQENLLEKRKSGNMRFRRA